MSFIDAGYLSGIFALRSFREGRFARTVAADFRQRSDGIQPLTEANTLRKCQSAPRFPLQLAYSLKLARRRACS